MRNINSYIVHTLLHPHLLRRDVVAMCDKAVLSGFAGVCVPPYYVREAKTALKVHSKIEIATVISYPMGYAHTASKVEEIKRAADDGAQCVYIAVNTAAVLDDHWRYVANDIESTATTAHLKGIQASMMVDVEHLKSRDLQKLCRLFINSGAECVLSYTVSDLPEVDIQSIHLLKRFVKDKLKLIVTGSVDDRDQAMALIEAGVDKIGTENGLQIIQSPDSNTENQ